MKEKLVLTFLDIKTLVFSFPKFFRFMKKSKIEFRIAMVHFIKKRL